MPDDIISNIYSRPPRIALPYPVGNRFVVFTSIDLEKRTFTGNTYNTLEDALDFCHEWSKHQRPKWHEAYCDRCKK